MKLQQEHPDEPFEELLQFYKPSKEELRYNNWKLICKTNNTSTAISTTTATTLSDDEEEDPTQQDAQQNNDVLNRLEIEIASTRDQYVDTTTQQTSDETTGGENEEKLSEYLQFRREKLQNPCIRRRLIRCYGLETKEKYQRITKYVNHLKLSCSLGLFTFTALLSLKLDQFIFWDWFFIYLPLLWSSVVMLGLLIFLWLPTLSWPLVLYRWVMKDFVGWWTSWAYAFSLKGRITQIIFGILFCSSPIIGFFNILFPSIIPTWMPVLTCGAAFAIWTYSGTQISYKEAKKFYPVMMIFTALSMTTWCGMIILKLMFLRSLNWSIVCIPMYLATVCLIIFQFKLAIDLNISTICLHALYWNLIFCSLLAFLVPGQVLLILKVDEVLPLPFTVVLIPIFVIELFMNVYYVLKAFTKKITHWCYKNPFTIVTGGVKNTAAMNDFVV